MRRVVLIAAMMIAGIPVLTSATYPDGELALYDVTIRIKEPPARENKL